MIVNYQTPPLFTFSDQEIPCSYWSDGRHIVSMGTCRCGRNFCIMERMPVEFSLDSVSLPDLDGSES